MSEFDSDSRDTKLSEIHQLGDSRNILQSIFGSIEHVISNPTKNENENENVTSNS